jgi:peptide/nickel transport system substrate-binding protein
MTREKAGSITRKELLALLGGGIVAAGAGARIAVAADRSVLKISFRSSIKRLDPAFTISGDEYTATQTIYDNLTRLDLNLNVIPGVAESWSSPDGGKTWVFKLRKGVKFHHGRELEAEDVVFSARRVLDPKAGSPGRRAIGPIAEVVATDKSTVTFTLEGPFADFPAIMSGTFMRIVPHDASENLDQKPVGTGPFRLAEWMPGQAVRLARNADYWMPGLPKLEEVWIVSYPVQAAEQAALSSGETQMMWELPTSLEPAVRKLPNITVTEISSTGFQPLVMRSDRPPFNDPRVRQAVKHAINRELVMRFVLQGHGSVAQDTPVPPSSAFFTKVAAPPYDPAKARALLSEAGVAGKLSLQLFASNERAGCIENAQVVKPMLEAVGIKVDIQQVPWDRFNAEVWKKETLFISNWIGRPTIDEELYPYFHSTGSWNEYNYSNPEIDRLLDQARRELDLSARKSAYAKVQEILAAEGPAIICYFSNYITAKVATLEDTPVHPLRWLDLRESRFKA